MENWQHALNEIEEMMEGEEYMYYTYNEWNHAFLRIMKDRHYTDNTKPMIDACMARKDIIL